MTSTIRVLHVEDEPEFGRLTADYLERGGRLEVETTTTASEALDRLESDGIDCVVSDHDLPTISGLELLETVRERHPTVPFILFTGKGSEEVASEAISAGVTDYLQKGSDPDRFALLANRITNAVDAAAARRRSERREREYRSLVEAAPVPMVVIDDDGTVLYGNRSAVEATAADGIDDLVGRSAFDLLHPDEHEEGRRRVRTVFEERESVPSREYRFVALDGAVRHAHGAITPVTFEDEPAAQVVLQDITDRKRHEADLARERDRFRAIFEAVPAPLVHVEIVDDEPIILRINDAFAEGFDVTPEVAVGSSLDDLIVPADRADEATDLTRRVAEEGVVEAVVRRRAVDGVRTFQFAAAPIGLADGDDIEWVASYVDISDKV